MKKLFCIFLFVISMTVLLPGYLVKANIEYIAETGMALNSKEKPSLKAAGNPIKPSQSRVTYKVKGVSGSSYNIYFSGVRETKRHSSKGDLIYKGDYTLYTQKIGEKKIVASKFFYNDYSLNATKKTVHLYPSSKKGQPDILAVAQIKNDKIETADWYYMKNGVLTKIVSGLSYTLRAERTGKNQLRTATYIKKDSKWHINQLNFNPSSNKMENRKINPVNIEGIIRGWWPDWK